MSKNSSEISGFYNSYKNRQEKVGINLRHRTILNRLLELGLRDAKNILEIGCGIGTLTSLIRKKNSSARIVATDISPANIESAKNNYGSTIEWIVSDMSDFSETASFDFIIFADVLEHIPIELHHALFQKVAKLSNIGTKVCINIPHPDYLEYVIKNQPELLQIVDQPLHGERLFPAFFSNGFRIISLQSYSLWTTVFEYQWIVLTKRIIPDTVQKGSKMTIILSDLKARLRALV